MILLCLILFLYAPPTGWVLFLDCRAIERVEELMWKLAQPVEYISGLNRLLLQLEERLAALATRRAAETATMVGDWLLVLLVGVIGFLSG